MVSGQSLCDQEMKFSLCLSSTIMLMLLDPYDFIAEGIMDLRKKVVQNTDTSV